MKRFLFFFVALVTYVSGAWAQTVLTDCLTIEDVDMVPGGSATVTVSITQEGIDAATATGLTTGLVGFTLDMYLPAGITPETDIDDEEEDPVPYIVTTSSTVNPNYSATTNPSVDGDVTHIMFLVTNMTNTKSLKAGAVFSFTLNASQTVEAKTYDVIVCGSDGKTSNIKISGKKNTKFLQAPFSFKINMPLTLDETTSYEAFPDFTGKLVCNRSISAGKWNTICLPFNISNTDMKEIFGDDVALATFDECVTYRRDNKVTGLGLHFSSVPTPAITANTPYLIKLPDSSEGITSFTVESEIVNSTSTPASGIFIGNYSVYDKNLGSTDHPVLFLSNNKFLIAIGKTSLKSFRGYFDVGDDLVEYRSNRDAASNITLFVDDEATSIEGLTMEDNLGEVYDLQGRLVKVQNNDMNSLQKGIYIINGKKVTIK